MNNTSVKFGMESVGGGKEKGESEGLKVIEECPMNV
jgi:hypothetical protein